MQRSSFLTVIGWINVAFGCRGLVAGPLGILGGSPVAGSVQMVLSALLLASGIGILCGAPWGRRVALGYAVSSLLTLPLQLQPMLGAAGDDPEVAAGVAVVVGLSALLMAVYPVVLLIGLTRREVVQATDGATTTDARTPTPDADRTMSHAVSAIIPYQNPAALAAYYLGVFALIPGVGAILGPLALIYGIKGNRFAAQHPTAGGSGHAWAGIILGGICSAVSVAFVVMMFYTVAG